MNVLYNENEIQPLGLSDVAYTESTGVLPKEGTLDPTGFPAGLSIATANATNVGYGYVLTFNKGNGVYGETQVFIPHNISVSASIPYQIKIRSCTDYTLSKVGWTPWESVAYVRDIDSRVNAILKEKGLI